MVKKKTAFVTVSYLARVRPRPQHGLTDRQPHRGEKSKTGRDFLLKHERESAFSYLFFPSGSIWAFPDMTSRAHTSIEQRHARSARMQINVSSIIWMPLGLHAHEVKLLEGRETWGGFNKKLERKPGERHRVTPQLQNIPNKQKREGGGGRGEE